MCKNLSRLIRNSFGTSCQATIIFYCWSWGIFTATCNCGSDLDPFHSTREKNNKTNNYESIWNLHLLIFFAQVFLLGDNPAIGQAITADVFANLLRQLQEKIEKNRCEKLALEVLFHEDNVPNPKAPVALAATHGGIIEHFEHPFYFSNMIPVDFCPFLQIKFHSINDVS